VAKAFVFGKSPRLLTSKIKNRHSSTLHLELVAGEAGLDFPRGFMESNQLPLPGEGIGDRIFTSPAPH
jgi:hypothetical protein